MSYQHCGYPNMSIKKFKEKYPQFEVTKKFREYEYTISYSKEGHTKQEIARFSVGNGWYIFRETLYKDNLIDDIRLLYKYLKKEMKNTEIYSKRKEK